MKKKSIIRRLLIPSILVLALAALVIFVFIPLYSQKDDQVTALPEELYFQGESETLVIENDALQLSLDTETTQFKLTNKKTGQVWLSIPEKAANDTVARSSQANLYALQSTLVLAYTDKDKGTADITVNNYQRSIVNQNFEIGEVTDHSIEVRYAIGDIQKIYLMPYAITEERYQQFTKVLIDNKILSKSKVNSKIGNVYQVYSPETLAKKSAEEREAILALYPIAAEQPIRVLNTGTKADYKSIEGYFEQAGYTQEDFEEDQKLIAGTKSSEKPIFNVTVRYRLEGGDFIVEIPFEEIRYRANYPITSLTVLPMFGAAGTDEQGFMLVPEGGGALINMNNGKLSQNSYYANMYGYDYGTYRIEVINETKTSFPLFGISKGGHSFICMIEGGAAYAGVQADISMRYNSYNSVSAKYTMVHSDQYNVSEKTGTKVYMFEKQLGNDTIVQRYRFLETDNYVDMANAYGEYLRDRFPELKTKQADADVPVSVELIGAIDKKIVKFGMPVDSVVPTTTFAEAQTIIGELTSAGVKDLNVRFSGWANGGVNQRVLTSVHVEGGLGGTGGMKKLIEYAKEQNVPLYFDGVTMFAYDSGLLNGFMAQRDAARYTTRERIRLYPYSQIYFKSDENRDPYYLVAPGYASSTAKTLVKHLASNGAAGIAFRDIGFLLASDFNQNKVTTREQAKEMQIETLKNAREAVGKVMIKEGFDYVLPYADMITDMDLDGTQYSILDTNVPFLQIAIHGAVNYTGRPINLANDWQTELLTCAEYGAGLNFTFMQKDGKIVQESNYSSLYGANYKGWKDDAIRIITDYQTAMAGLNRQKIVGHESLTSKVSVTTYENGAKVYVNYSSDAYETAGLTIPARSYLVEGGEAK